MKASRHRSLVEMAAGFAVWATAFIVIYALQSLGCARGWDQVSVGPTSVLRALLVGLFILVLGASAAIAATAFRKMRHDRSDGGDRTARFVRRVAAATALAATGAAAVTFAGVTALSMCD